MKQLEFDFDEAIDKDYSAVVEVEDDKVKVWRNPLIIDASYTALEARIYAQMVEDGRLKEYLNGDYSLNLVGKPDESI